MIRRSAAYLFATALPLTAAVAIFVATRPVQPATAHPAAKHPSPYWRLERRYARLHAVQGRLGRMIRRLRGQLQAQRRRQARTLQAAHASPVGTSSLERAFLCIHAGEGTWTDPNPPYYGGLQFDSEFEHTYGPEFVAAWGHATNWPRSVQITVAIRAWLSGRGFAPWPVTSRACGLR